MMKKVRKLLFLIMLTTVIIACRPTNDDQGKPGPVSTLSSMVTSTMTTRVEPLATWTPQKPTDTLVVLPTTGLVASPTLDPKPKATTTPTLASFHVSLEVSGKVFISSPDADWLVDFDTGNLTKPRIDLCSVLAPGSTITVCEKFTDIYNFYDVATGERVNSFFYPESCKLGWSSDGKYFYLGVGKCEVGETLQVVQYGDEGDLETIIPQYLYGRWLWVPTAFSANGEHFVEIRENTAFEITDKGERKLFTPRLTLTGDLAWAPVSQRFLIGLTDIQQEIRPLPNFLYVYDFQTGSSIKLQNWSRAFFRYSIHGRPGQVMKNMLLYLPVQDSVSLTWKQNTNNASRRNLRKA